MFTKLIKVYHSFNKWRNVFKNFMDDIGKTLEDRKMTFGLNYSKWEFFYSFDSSQSTYSAFESQFYTSFSDFQIIKDKKGVWNYNMKKTAIWELRLENNWFFPIKLNEEDDTDFIFNMFRTFENFDVINDKIWIFYEITPLKWENILFYIKSNIQFVLFKIWLFFQFFKYMFNFKIQKWRKKTWYDYFKKKLNQELFETKIFIVAQGINKDVAEGKIKGIFNNFLVFKNYPLNQFNLKTYKDFWSIKDFRSLNAPIKKYILSSEEISSLFHFPKNPKNETALLKVTSRKLALPIWVPNFDYKMLPNWEILPKEYPDDVNILWISDYRSITVPVGIYDEDRLRHMYIIWKTWVGKSKFIMASIVDDITQWKWVGIIDPHGDLIEEALMHVPESRKKDVIIFDPTDEKFPFCLNPLDINEEESKQILAKWFIDIFKKFFWANWNAKLEHVLRMIFLALLDKPNSTLFDIIRALTDKDFRYDMIENIEDDVVRNFWTNEFAGWSQQFNTEAIMPILNKVGQLLSIDILKNIFASTENKLDFRKMMDEKKILLVKLPKGKLQEDIMWFLGAMFVTKIYQAAMGRQSLAKNKRTPFYLYVDEFQNFATETFNEILSEARKYGLWITVAHQFIKQIPEGISDALFGNVGTLVSFRISSEDAGFMKQHFEPFLDTYDLATLNQREFYAKMLVKWETKDPFSIRSLYIPDPDVDMAYIKSLYEISRGKYSRSLKEAKKVVEETQKEVLEKIEEFAEPLI